VLGRSGSGKSTLLHILGALDRPDRGTVEVAGIRLERERERELTRLRRRHVGFVFQSFHLLPELTGLENVLLPARLARDRNGAVARAQALVESLGLGEPAQRLPETLSGGEQQRLLIAQAFVARPKLLILDEPLDRLDLPNQAAVAALVRRLASAENVAVLLVAHDVNPLLPYLDRVMYLAGGRALSGPIGEVITAPALSSLYGAPIEVLHTADGRLVVVGLPEAPHHHGDRHQ
jgi:zinc/manganese transport system ATP-binding protein